MLGHMGLKGNERTDETAKEVAKRKSTGKRPERFYSLTHVEHTISERTWIEAKHWFKTEHD